jgi:alpha-galactosidase
MISFDEKTGIFHLKNDSMSYVIELARGKYLLHRYWGKPLHAFRGSTPLAALDRAFCPQPAAYENERTFSLDNLPLEFSADGHGDFRIPSLSVRLADGTKVIELFYQSHEITPREKKDSGSAETAEKVSIHFTNRYKCHLLGICTDFLV